MGKHLPGAAPNLKDVEVHKLLFKPEIYLLVCSQGATALFSLQVCGVVIKASAETWPPEEITLMHIKVFKSVLFSGGSLNITILLLHKMNISL